MEDKNDSPVKRKLKTEVSEAKDFPTRKKQKLLDKKIEESLLTNSESKNSCNEENLKAPKNKKKLLDDSDEEASEGENAESEEENVISDDSYKLHFDFELPDEFENKYTNLYKEETKESWPALGDFYMTDFSKNHVISTVPLKRKSTLQDFHLKENVFRSCQTSKLLNKGKLSSLQSEFFSLISEYRDVLFSNRTDDNGKQLRIVYCLHALNHILKAKAKIIHQNSKYSKNPDEEYRDQGFTRPVVLMLVPFREDCYQIVKILTTFLTKNVLNKSRFEKEYGSEKPQPKKRPRPEDFEKTFAGNIDEDFKIGLKIKNRSINLYAEFYSSELIIASPLGLRQIIGAEGDKERDFDFLSSIEVLIVDRGDIFMMQNWYHFNHILKHLNLLPKENHGWNLFRVRESTINGFSRFFRQTIFLSSVEHAWFKAMFHSGQCQNHTGYLRTCSVVKSPSVSQVISIPHVFWRFDSNSLQKEMDDRFDFFVSKVLPEFKDPMMARTLIFIPFYFDFLRLRNYFRSQELSCTMICEYSKSGKIAQARDLFFKGHRHFMLYTERAHFYKRYQIKGIQHIIFYQLPLYPHFYQEISNFLLFTNPARKVEGATETTCTVVITKADCLQLKQTVGIDRAIHMLNSNKKVFTISANKK